MYSLSVMFYQEQNVLVFIPNTEYSVFSLFWLWNISMCCLRPLSVYLNCILFFLLGVFINLTCYMHYKKSLFWSERNVNVLKIKSPGMKN